MTKQIITKTKKQPHSMDLGRRNYTQRLNNQPPMHSVFVMRLIPVICTPFLVVPDKWVKKNVCRRPGRFMAHKFWYRFVITNTLL